MRHLIPLPPKQLQIVQFENIIYENIDRIKEIINFEQNKCNQICLHLRLGDFYNKERHNFHYDILAIIHILPFLHTDNLK